MTLSNFSKRSAIFCRVIRRIRLFLCVMNCSSSASKAQAEVAGLAKGARRDRRFRAEDLLVVGVPAHRILARPIAIHKDRVERSPCLCIHCFLDQADDTRRRCPWRRIQETAGVLVRSVCVTWKSKNLGLNPRRRANGRDQELESFY